MHKSVCTSRDDGAYSSPAPMLAAEVDDEDDEDDEDEEDEDEDEENVEEAEEEERGEGGRERKEREEIDMSRFGSIGLSLEITCNCVDGMEAVSSRQTSGFNLEGCNKPSEMLKSKLLCHSTNERNTFVGFEAMLQK